MKETEYLNLTNDLVEDTLKLIAAREAKRNQPIKRWLRSIAIVLSVLFSFVVIGIPFFLKLQNEDKKFKAEIDQLKEAVLQANQTDVQVMLLKKLDNIPFILNKIKERYKDHGRQELINSQIRNDWQDNEKIPVDSRTPYDEEFERDIKKGASFQRIDKILNIEDQQPLPLHQSNGDLSVQEAASFLKELLKKPEDQRWLPVLQIAATHASLLTAFKAALSAFNIDFASVQWEANGQYYSIKSIFSNRSPPVVLEIIRHPKNETIEKVNVTIKGSMDIVSYHTAGNEDPKMLIPGAITEELTYSIAFGEDHLPVVNALHSHMKSNVSISRNK
jgi:hypothetical protein